MKRTSLVLLLFVSIGLLIYACSSKDYPSQIGQKETTDYVIPFLTKSAENNSMPLFKVKPKVITKEMLAGILSMGLSESSIKNTECYSLKTISENGTPIIHSVNFNEGGWALVAGRELPQNQIIAYCEDGSFDPENIESEEVQFWFNMTKASLKQAFEIADREVESQFETEDTHKEDEENLLSTFSYDDPYVWGRLYLGYQNSNMVVAEVGHLTETKWGQFYPWNYKAPSVNGQQCPVGCTAVAVSQMLYYLHYYLGTPSGCYHTIDTTYTWHNDGYYTSHLTRSDYTAPSSRWGSMSQESQTLNNGSKYVGDLLIDVADRLYTQFSLSGSSASTSLVPSVFSSYGITCSDPQSITTAQIISQLNDSMPVIVGGASSLLNGDAHMWIIDGYKEQANITDYQYKWVTMPPDSLQYYNNINYDYVLTESQMQQFYPNVVENQIDHVYSNSYTYYFRMNWGASGFYNSGYYSAHPSGWILEGSQYSENTTMITGFSN